MITPAPELHLPGNYADRLTDSDREIHEVWQQASLADVDNWTPQPVFTELADGRTIGHVELNDEGLSKREAIALLLPFANGMSPSMMIRAGIMQDFLDEPLPVLVYPNNTKGQDWYEIDPTSPSRSLASSVLESASKAGVEKLHVVGYSQGAMIGSVMLSQMRSKFDTVGARAMLGDAPNISVARTSKQLGKDFRADGTKPLNKAINDSAIPALSEAQHARGGLDSVRQLAMFAMFGLGANLPVNRGLRDDMAGSSFVLDTLKAPHDMRDIMIVRMAESKICTKLLDQELATMERHYSFAPRLEVVPEYGHEGGDNVVLHALLARDAIERPTAA